MFVLLIIFQVLPIRTWYRIRSQTITEFSIPVPDLYSFSHQKLAIQFDNFL